MTKRNNHVYKSMGKNIHCKSKVCVKNQKKRCWKNMDAKVQCNANLFKKKQYKPIW